MRKDTRIGVAIGLVLFAVLIVYAVVGNKSGNKKKVTLNTTGKTVAPTEESSARGVALPSDAANTEAATSGSASSEREQEAAAASAVPAKDASVPTGSDTAAESKGAENAAPNWAALLSATEKLDTAAHTRTPGLAGDNGASKTTGASGAGTPIRPGSGKDLIEASGGMKSDATPRNSAGSTGNTHRVQEGESFASIARTVYGDSRYTDEIRKANPSIDPKRLRPGMTIRLPEKAGAKSDAANAASTRTDRTGSKATAVNSAKEYAVQANDSLYKIAVKLYGKADKADELYELNKEKIGPDPARLRAGMVLKLPQPATPLTTASAVR